MEEYKYECIWYPRTDITTYELAKCIPYLFTKLHDIAMWDKLDKNITKHFVVSKYNYGKMIRKASKKLKKLVA